MNLHLDPEAFHELSALTAGELGIPVGAVKRDYYIVMLLQRLADSPYADQCVFKGGTSLSKCYPGSIQRFSEDIDLTFIPRETFSKKQYDKALKQVERLMTDGLTVEKITAERNDRNKSSYVYFGEGVPDDLRVKLEIGSSIRPDPYSLRTLKTYLQEYMEAHSLQQAVQEFDLQAVQLNTLCIERTFLDKVMAVKRHALCGTLSRKVRHIYDVTMLLDRPDIQHFLSQSEMLKELLKKTKQADAFYLEKRDISADYNPVGPYDFPAWASCFDQSIRSRYENLHRDLLYTNEKQPFSRALTAFHRISLRFAELGE